MKHYEQILVVVDPYAEAHPAVEKATALAQASAARLTLLICVYDEHLAGTRFGDSEHLRQSREKMLAVARDKLEALADPLRQMGLRIDIHALFGHPLHESIIAKARELLPDLIVKDTHYHHLLNRTVFSNTDWELIRLCPFNLMLVKADKWTANPVILAAVDPLHIGDKPAVLDHAILAQGKVLAATVAGRLCVVHCYPVTVPAAVAGAGLAMPASVDAEALRSSIEDSHRLALDRLVASYGVDPDDLFLVPGEPGKQLVAMARTQNADLMIVGAVSRSRLKTAFLGFTALRILDRVPCDLFIVKPPAT